MLPLGVTTEALATDAAVQKKKKKYGSGMTTLINSNEDLKDILEIVTYFEELGLLVKGVPESKTI